MKSGHFWKFYPSTSTKTSLFFKWGHRHEKMKLVNMGRVQCFQLLLMCFSLGSISASYASLIPGSKAHKFINSSLSLSFPGYLRMGLVFCQSIYSPYEFPNVLNINPPKEDLIQ